MKEPEFVSEVVRMYQSGANQKEIVETLGISYCQCRYWLKKRGLYDSSRRQHNTAPAQDHNKVEHQESMERLINDLHNNGFDYLGGYKANKSKAHIKCLTCGTIFQRVPRYWTYKCPECDLNATEFRVKRLQRRQLKRICIHIRARLLKRKKDREEQAIAEKEYHRLYDLHVCEWCNKMFTIKEYEERENKYNVQLLSYCSSECRKQQEKTYKGDHKIRALRHGVEYIPGITLKRLVDRDGLTCALCGGTCDWNDKRYGDCGPLYPSIDHVVPISKGGPHTWENVQVAHFKCNSDKSNQIDYRMGA